MKTWDVIIVGAGIIGISLAIELNKRGLKILIIEKGEPGREASWAAGGMLADCGLEIPGALEEMAHASAKMYPEFVHELEDASGLKIDLRDQGTLLLMGNDQECGSRHSPALVKGSQLRELEPNLQTELPALLLQERSIDPRGLTTAAIAAARHRGIEFSSGDEVTDIEITKQRVSGVRTKKTQFAAGTVVNCAGAWSGQLGPQRFPTRPVKGQMLCVIQPERETVRHVVRAPGVYLIPRSDGRLLIGATQEEAAFDKQTVTATLQQLHHAALALIPKLDGGRMLEAWAGLRPGTPDDLPILGATSTHGYFAATGHFRDGILLAPVTAKVMRQIISGQNPDFDLQAFRAERFNQ